MRKRTREKVRSEAQETISATENSERQLETVTGKILETVKEAKPIEVESLSDVNEQLVVEKEKISNELESIGNLDATELRKRRETLGENTSENREVADELATETTRSSSVEFVDQGRRVTASEIKGLLDKSRDEILSTISNQERKEQSAERVEASERDRMLKSLSELRG